MDYKSNEERLGDLEQQIAGLVKIVAVQQERTENDAGLLLSVCELITALFKGLAAFYPLINEKQRRDFLDSIAKAETYLDQLVAAQNKQVGKIN